MQSLAYGLSQSLGQLLYLKLLWLHCTHPRRSSMYVITIIAADWMRDWTGTEWMRACITSWLLSGAL